MVEIRSFPEGWGGEARRAIDDILDAHSIESGIPLFQEQLVVVAEEEGEMLGGLAATINNHWMHVDLLAVHRHARRRGIGRQLMAEAESLARARGLVGLWLDTHGFQAPGFYPRLGYALFGSMDDNPPGHRRFFFCKRLDAGNPP
jgi:GNAT superfamily N-acetyltransferase